VRSAQNYPTSGV